MDISKDIPDEVKKQIGSLITETQVLKALLDERNQILSMTLGKLLNALQLDPKTYQIKCNAGKNIWEAQLRGQAFIVPGQKGRQN